MVDGVRLERRHIQEALNEAVRARRRSMTCVRVWAGSRPCDQLLESFRPVRQRVAIRGLPCKSVRITILRTAALADTPHLAAHSSIFCRVASSKV